MLTKVLMNASSGLPDAHAKVNNAISADMIFLSSTHTNRYSLARFLTRTHNSFIWEQGRIQDFYGRGGEGWFMGG